MEGKNHKEHNGEPHEHHKGEHHTYFTVKKLNILIILFAVILLVITAFNIIQTITITDKLTGMIEDVEEANRPAEIELISITNNKCADCFDISPAIESIKSKNVKILDEKEIDFNSHESQELIAKYNVEKIPTIIVTGEINKIDLGLNNQNDEVLLLKEIKQPYTEAKTGIVKGKVKLIYLKADCKDCVDLNLFIQSLKDNVKIVDEKTYEFGSKEENELIKKYNIEKLPSFILSEDIEEYKEINAQLESTGTKESDGYYVFREIFAPYYDLKDKKVKGLVTLTYLEDKECADCYNVENHKLILDRFGIKISEEKKVDTFSSEGKKLIRDYDIEKVPTIILSKDTEEYTQFKDVWSAVGTIESDRTYIFRNVEVMGKYKDLTTNQLVNPAS